MCGRFSQSMTREDYLALIAEEAERDIPFDQEPIVTIISAAAALLVSPA